MKLNSGTVVRYMTVLDVIQRSAAYLAERGVSSARLQAELLLAHVLKLPRLRLYLNFDRVLTEPELAATRDLVKRRGLRVPLQHLTGSVGFLAHDIKVTAAVLVPRPETETLAQLAIGRLQQLLAATPGAIEVQSAGPRVLDFGTGSGCLAIALAAAVPAAEVHAPRRFAGRLDASPRQRGSERRRRPDHVLRRRWLRRAWGYRFPSPGSFRADRDQSTLHSVRRNRDAGSGGTVPRSAPGLGRGDGTGWTSIAGSRRKRRAGLRPRASCWPNLATVRRRR